MKSVSIVDYGVGNLLSVARAFNYFGAKVEFVQTPEEILCAERLILPGVGAFSDGMKGLQERGLVEALRQYAKRDNPFMGICLGMQMMMSKSNEFGDHEGLGLIAGDVVSIPTKGLDGKSHKIPHIGWNELLPTSQGSSWENTLLNGLDDNASVYFVHSFMVVSNNPAQHLAEARYNGHAICAVVQQENVYGCQFHPEKSGEVGLKIIQNFLAI